MNRAVWIDGLRGTAILLVIVWHTMHYSGASLRETWLWSASGQLGSLRMPLLFLLSGLFLSRALAKPGITFLYGKFANLAWPFFIWALILIPLKFGYDGLFDVDRWGTSTELWFMFYLLIYFGVAYFLKAFSFGLLAAASLIVTMTVAPETLASKFGIYAIFFFSGAAIGPMLLRVRAGVTPARIFCLITLSALHIGIQLLIPQGARTHLIVEPIPFLLTAVPLVAIATIVGCMFFGTQACAPLQWVGQHSVVFYLTHMPFLFLVKAITSPLGVSDGWAAFFVLVASVAGGVFLVRLRKNPWVDALFLFPLQIVPPRVRAFFCEIMSDPSERQERFVRRAVRNENALS